MQPMKFDHVTDGAVLRPLPAELTYCAIVDVLRVEREITDFMVRRACEEMDTLQQYPFTGRKPKKRR